MKLIAQVKLQPTPEQTAYLKRTLETANSAADFVSEHAWDTGTFRQYDLHHALYYEVRERFALSAQMTVRLLAKVADAYKLDRQTRRVFKALGSIAYDDRILSWNPDRRTVSIWTVVGRKTIPFVAGGPHLNLLRFRLGEADLIYRNGEFYLHQVCEVDEPPAAEVDAFLGLDLGLINLAMDSDGEGFSGEQVEKRRRKFAHRRRNLQRKQTRAAKRKLRQLSGKQARFQTNTNHTISKRVVQKAQDTGRGIALENLNGIRDRVTVQRKQRARHANWSFYQLRQFIEYKAALAGIPVVLVDPRNTSRTCPACGCIDKRNRSSQSIFSCVSCGFSAPADTVAAWNIQARAVVNQPNELSAQGSASG